MSHFGVGASTALLEYLLNGDATGGSTSGVDLSTMGINQTLSDTGNDLYIALCTGNPGEGATGAISNECTQANYAGYARKAISRYKAYNLTFRPAMQWSISSGIATNVSAQNFNTCTGASGAVITHWALCKDASTAVTNNTAILRGVIMAPLSIWYIGYYTDTAVGTIYSASHGLVDDDLIRVSRVYDAVGLFPDAGADRLYDGNTYYVKAATTHTFQLSLTSSSGANLTLLPTSRGSLSFIDAAAAGTVTVSTNTIPSFSAGSLKIALY